MSFRRPNKGELERRFMVVQELRVAGTEDEPVIEGYAAVFGSLSLNLGGFRERIRQGAFTKTIQEADIRALFNHDPNYVLGRKRAGTLELAEDERGLFMRVRPPKAQWAADLVESIRRGDVDQQSFSFRTIRDEWTEEDNEIVRTLVEVRLFDVGPVTFPAYESTTIQARTLEGLGVSLEEFADAFERARSGAELDHGARAILHSVHQALASLPVAPAAGPPGPSADHPADDEQRAAEDLALRKRRLELAAAT